MKTNPRAKKEEDGFHPSYEDQSGSGNRERGSSFWS